jgi:hypothetical protein
MNHLEPRPGPGAAGYAVDSMDPRDSKLLLPKEVNGKQHEPLAFLLDMMHHHKEGSGKQKLKQPAKASSEPTRKPAESPRATEGQPKPRLQTESKAKVVDFTPLSEQKREERKVNSNNNNKKQLNHIREEKSNPVPLEPPSPVQPQQNGRLILADSPQPKGKNKKSKKKKGDRASSSIGKYRVGGGWGACLSLLIVCDGAREALAAQGCCSLPCGTICDFLTSSERQMPWCYILLF